MAEQKEPELEIEGPKPSKETEAYIDAILEAARAMIPESGYNVVGVDRYAVPTEALYFVENFKTREEAEQHAKKMKAENPEDDFWVYAPLDEMMQEFGIEPDEDEEDEEDEGGEEEEG